MRADLFSPLPAEGYWDHVLLIDRNIGFPCSHVGADALGDLAHAAGLVSSRIIHTAARVIAVLTIRHCGGLPA